MTGAGSSDLAGEGPAITDLKTAIDPAELARDLLRMAAIPVNNDVLDAALRLVVALARVTVGGADGVSVSLRRRGELTTVAASDETVSGMDRDQYATGEGPCVSAATEGHWFHVESLDDERRWPAFIPRARQRGINNIISTPLLSQTRPVGALNIYSRVAGAFAAPDLELSSLFAARASDLLVSAAVDVPLEELSRQLQDALRGRDVIVQARAVLMERHRVTDAAAFTQLRRSARRTNTPVHRIAEDIMASTQPPASGGVAASDDA